MFSTLINSNILLHELVSYDFASHNSNREKKTSVFICFVFSEVNNKLKNTFNYPLWSVSSGIHAS